MFLFSDSNKKLFNIFVVGVVIGSLWVLPINFVKSDYFSSSFMKSHQVSAQEIINSTDDLSTQFNPILIDNSTKQQNEPIIVTAFGHFANNQIKSGVVTWIQGGLWNLDIKNIENKTLDTSNMTADFKANFTMIKPDGSLIHNHKIDNFKSDNVIFAGNDVVVVGTSDILSDNGIEFAQVPITIHLMGKNVLGLMIDVNKTGGHFSGDNEMFGTLISGVGLDESDSNNTNTISSLTEAKPNNSSIVNSMAQMTH